MGIAKNEDRTGQLNMLFPTSYNYPQTLDINSGTPPEQTILVSIQSRN